MNTISTFKILLGCDISDNNQLIIPNNFNLQALDKHIREFVYLYFNLIENNILDKTLTFDDIAKFINNDSDFPIIPNTINPEIYYSKNITLNKYFKFDYDFLESIKQNSTQKRIVPNYSVKYNISGSEFWNVNYYLQSNYITIEEAANFKHASEVVNLEYIILNPDLFNLNIIYKRFKKQIKPKYFKEQSNKVKYILKILKEFPKEKYEDDYFVSDYTVLKSLFDAKTKRLPENFDEIVLELSPNEIPAIADMYVKWLITNYKPEYLFDDLLINAPSLDELFEKGLNVPTYSKRNLNFSEKYLTFNDLFVSDIGFENDCWNKYLDKKEYLMTCTDFRNLKKFDCIAFYNKFYDDSVEFVKTVFEGKLLLHDDYKLFEHCSPIQVEYFVRHYPKTFKGVDNIKNVLYELIEPKHILNLLNKDIINEFIPNLDRFELIEIYECKIVYRNEIERFNIIYEYTDENKNDLIKFINKNSDKVWIKSKLNSEVIKNIDTKALDLDYLKYDVSMINYFIEKGIKYRDDEDEEAEAEDKYESDEEEGDNDEEEGDEGENDENENDESDEEEKQNNSCIAITVPNTSQPIRLQPNFISPTSIFYTVPNSNQNQNQNKNLEKVCENNIDSENRPLKNIFYEIFRKSTIKDSFKAEIKNGNETISYNILVFYKLFNFDLLKFSYDIYLNQHIIEFMKEINYKFLFNYDTKIYKNIETLFDEVCNLYINDIYTYVETYIKSNSKLKFNEIINKIEQQKNDKIAEHEFDNLACTWCQYRKENPPFEMWPETPNRDLQQAYRNYISEELPKEYVNKKYYDYMMKNRFNKFDDSTTLVYTLLSNNVENKIIFTSGKTLLDDKFAKLRYIISKNYNDIQKFCCEELETNNISMLTSLNDYDFAKVSGGESSIDCFVFSDTKNIYRERTPLSKVLKFFKDAIEMKFDINIKVEC